jgi:cytochrome c oxidase assembly protein subunit 11
MADPKKPLSANDRRNGRIVISCAATVAIMTALSFAAVPLYQEFCRVTGYGGTTRVGLKAPGAVKGAIYTIRFDANVGPGLPWRFEPEQREIKVRPGAQSLALYRAVNESAHATAGQATYNVTPELAGQYFTKIACFCFNEQHLAAGQKADMPVTFYVDPAILKDPDLTEVHTITLSYTFYPAPSEKPQAGRTYKETGENGAGRG